MNITIYHTKGCQRCRLTKLLLNREVKEVLVTPNDTELINSFKKKGISSFPIVEVFKENDLVDEWNGFNPDKINVYKQ